MEGRYREYQCMLNSQRNGLVQIVDQVFSKLKINTVVKINNRKILAGIAETIGEKDRMLTLPLPLISSIKLVLKK